jgi:hypothetical protein
VSVNSGILNFEGLTIEQQGRLYICTLLYLHTQFGYRSHLDKSNASWQFILFSSSEFSSLALFRIWWLWILNSTSADCSRQRILGKQQLSFDIKISAVDFRFENSKL